MALEHDHHQGPSISTSQSCSCFALLTNGSLCSSFAQEAAQGVPSYKHKALYLYENALGDSLV